MALAHVDEAAALLVSELVTNAVRHAEGVDVVTVNLHAGRTWLRIEVQDTDRHWPQPRNPGRHDESGFGFILVNALASNGGEDKTRGQAVCGGTEQTMPQESGRESRAVPLHACLQRDAGPDEACFVVARHHDLNPVAQGELGNIRPTWDFTVASETNKYALAISVLDMPLATAMSTSRSRSVSAASSGTVGLLPLARGQRQHLGVLLEQAAGHPRAR